MRKRKSWKQTKQKASNFTITLQNIAAVFATKAASTKTQVLFAELSIRAEASKNHHIVSKALLQHFITYYLLLYYLLGYYITTQFNLFVRLAKS